MGVLLLLISYAQRTRYLNAVNTLSELLSMGVVPIVNENDTISVSVCIVISSLDLPNLVLTQAIL